MTESDPPLRNAPPPAILGTALLHTAALASLVTAWETWPWVAAAVAANHAAMAAVCVSPRSRLLGANIARLPAASRNRGEVALTFDDGPDAIGTPKVLDILDRHGATASFFCIGARAARDPGLVREIVARGHFVENHTFRHGNGFAFGFPRGLAAEIGEAQDVLTSLTGRAPVFFRAPMGIRGPWLQPVLCRFNLSLVSWTRRGFDGVRADPGAVLARLSRGLAAGDVLVLHDGGPSGGHAAVQALPRLLETIADRGLRAVSLTQAFSLKGAFAPAIASVKESISA